MTDPTSWWRDAVVYQIYIRSFADADGDGIGDLGGIHSRLPYLRDLGIDAIWLTPFYPSPMADGGYDVADYRDIEPLFGTLADAEAVIAEAHGLDLRVIIDIVPNHTSHLHPWFQAALESPKGSPERDRYIFRPGRGPEGAEPPNDWEATFGGSAWQRLPDGDWYLHLFAPEQPDLNWEHPEVVEDFHRTLRFWFDRGVDGFRIDVANSLKKDQSFPDLGLGRRGWEWPVDEPHPIWDRDEVHEIYREWRRIADEYDGDRAFVAEAWVDDPERLARYVRRDELHTAFNFQYLRQPWEANALHRTIDACIATTAAVDAPTTWVLSNHDVPRHLTRYGRVGHTGLSTDEHSRPQPGELIDLERGTRRARASLLLTLALPGSAYLYQGEELGLPEVIDLPEELLADPIWERSGHTLRGRDGCRVPLPWTTSGPSLGFGSGAPWLPQPPEWAALSAQAQDGVPGSMLELYRRALAARRADPSLGDGGLQWLDASDDVLAFRRTGAVRHDHARGAAGADDTAGSPGTVCIVNLGADPVEVATYGTVRLTSDPLTSAGELPADTAVWLAPL